MIIILIILAMLLISLTLSAIKLSRMKQSHTMVDNHLRCLIVHGVKKKFMIKWKINSKNSIRAKERKVDIIKNHATRAKKVNIYVAVNKIFTLGTTRTFTNKKFYNNNNTSLINSINKKLIIKITRNTKWSNASYSL